MATVIQKSKLYYSMTKRVQLPDFDQLVARQEVWTVVKGSAAAEGWAIFQAAVVAVVVGTYGGTKRHTINYTRVVYFFKYTSKQESVLWT